MKMINESPLLWWTRWIPTHPSAIHGDTKIGDSLFMILHFFSSAFLLHLFLSISTIVFFLKSMFFFFNKTRLYFLWLMCLRYEECSKSHTSFWECYRSPFSFLDFKDCQSDVCDRTYERIIDCLHTFNSVLQIQAWRIAFLCIRETWRCSFRCKGCILGMSS